ncbi:MAG: hypothetical protein R3263_04630, partial [Myxococcota bacterium]|nr:hypothetical protein [Myxococcota bacterium]
MSRESPPRSRASGGARRLGLRTNRRVARRTARLGLLVLLACSPAGSESFEEARARMVREQIAARDVEDPRVLEAMRRAPRHAFVPEPLRSRAYADRPLPIGHGQTISQPYVVAFMTEAADVEPGERVLEVG